MNYLTYGNKKNKVVVLIHGMATTALKCYGKILCHLTDYYVVLVEVDGHIPDSSNCLTSFKDACSKVERYIKEELNNEIYCLGGFSMGATMAVEIAGRNHIKVEKLFLDAAFLVNMGTILTKLYTFIFCFFIDWIKKGKSVPTPLLDSIMGKGNRAIINMLYYGIDKKTIQTVCQYVYTYQIHEEIKYFKGEVLFLYGSHEPYPSKSAKLLSSYIPNLKMVEIKDMGHGQFLLTKPKEYSDLFIKFLKEKNL